ncbi:MAG: glycosyltransferase [Lachnospiraceae bacterium]|nr:glycosyltransferase [Lachnospiraceae bacterium]
MIPEQDLISVIVPVYKAEDYIGACIESILAQTYQNLQVILIEDGSPDGSAAVCDRYAARDGRIEVIHQENAGVSVSRNVGVTRSRGKWIVFIDADDTAHPGMIETLHDAAVSHNAQIAWCGFYETEWDGVLRDHPVSQQALGRMLEEKSYPIRELTPREAELQFYALGKMSECMVPWNKIYLASLYGEGEERLWYPPGKVFEDGYITYRLIWRAQKIVTIDAPLYYYRQWRGGIMKKNGNRNYADAMGCSIEKMDFYKAQGDRELYLKEVNYSVYNAIRFYKAGGSRKDKKEIRKWFKRFYYEYFRQEKWPFAKKLRIQSFLLGYPFYAALSAFEGAYNRLRKEKGGSE